MKQYSKKIITSLVTFAIIWITWSYCLATYALVIDGSFEPLQTLSETVCTTVIATVIGYFCKSFLETFAEKTITPFFEDKNININNNSQNDFDI